MRVLVVEDEEYLAEAIATGLRREAMAVDVVGDGASALEQVAVNDYDIIVLDLGLPDIDGLDVARQVRAQGLTIPILMLTARSEDSDLVVGLDAGADDYVTKPFRLAELLARVRAQVRRASGEWSTPATSRRVRARIRAMALPPPQPTSSTLSRGWIPAASSPHRCRRECPMFMPRSSRRPVREEGRANWDPVGEASCRLRTGLR